MPSDLVITISGDRRRLRRELDSADKDLGRFSDSTKSRMKAVGLAAAGAAASFGTAGLAFGIKKAVDEWRDAAKVTAQTEAVLKSTGNAANVTAGQVSRLAERLSLVAGVDDEVIQRGANMLLTFKDIRNEVGKNNDIFNQTVRATLDMAAAMAAANNSEINLRTASIQVGKALNDPIKGVTALSRVGVQFSDSQRAVIERLVESGRKMDAQRLILRELRSEFAGSARANADAMDRIGVAIDNIFEKFGKKLAPIVTEVATKLARFVIQMNSGRGAGGRFVKQLEEVGRVLADVWKVIKFGIGLLVDWNRLFLRLPKLWVDVAVAAIKAGKAIVEAIRGAFNVVKKAAGDAIAFVLRRFGDMVEVAAKIPIIGDKFEGLARDINRAADRADQLGENIRKVPKKISVEVQLKALQTGDFDLLQPPGKVFGPGGGDGIGLSIKKYTRREGLRQLREVGPLPLFGGGGSANLMGAGQHLAPFARLGAGMGLSVTSGFRPGSITSSGNLSYHAMRRAIDMADGPAQMLAYARVMAARFGGRLKELIHTPMGFSIKDGRQTAPYAQADHYDHVHVAMERGGRVKRAVRALVGEKGPEVVDLPANTVVHPAWKSRLMRRKGDGGGIVPGYSGSQSSIIHAIFRAAKRSGATRDQVIAAMMIGLVESNFSNPTMAESDRDSAGWRQERSHYGPESTRRNPGAAAMRVFRELRGVSGTPGAMAQAVQRSAFPGRYAERAGEALRLWGYYQANYRGDGRRDGGRAGRDRREPLTRAERRERERRRIAQTPVRGRTTTGAIGELQQDIGHERRWEGLQGIREDEQITPREHTRATAAYMRRAAEINQRIKLKRDRLFQINRALRGPLRPATRKRLLDEKAQIISDIGSLRGEKRGLEADYKGLVAPFEPSEPGSPFAQVEMQAALAALTPGTADDLAAAQERLRISQGGLAYAQTAFAQGLTTPDVVTEWANNVKQSTEAVEALTGAIDEERRSREAHTAVLQEIDKNQKTIIATAQAQGPALEQALLMIVNGGLGGSAGLGRSFPSFAGLGGLART